MSTVLWNLNTLVRIFLRVEVVLSSPRQKWRARPTTYWRKKIRIYICAEWNSITAFSTKNWNFQSVKKIIGKNPFHHLILNEKKHIIKKHIVNDINLNCLLFFEFLAPAFHHSIFPNTFGLMVPANKNQLNFVFQLLQGDLYCRNPTCFFWWSVFCGHSQSAIGKLNSETNYNSWWVAWSCQNSHYANVETKICSGIHWFRQYSHRSHFSLWKPTIFCLKLPCQKGKNEHIYLPNVWWESKNIESFLSKRSFWATFLSNTKRDPVCNKIYIFFYV